jgi:hypothetical protein
LLSGADFRNDDYDLSFDDGHFEKIERIHPGSAGRCVEDFGFAVVRFNGRFLTRLMHDDLPTDWPLNSVQRASVCRIGAGKTTSVSRFGPDQATLVKLRLPGWLM